jgi:hypothetical protein
MEATMQKISIKHMGNTHHEWLRALDFYKQELHILKGRLTEIAGKNTAINVAKEIDHFENQFLIQEENIDKLRSYIHRNLANTRIELQKSHAGYIDADLMEQHESIQDHFMSEEKTINELRREFNRFAAEWM